MLNLDEIYLAEYSPQQKCFHVATAEEAMESNLRQILGGWTNSYLPFAVCSSAVEASRACDTLAKAMLDRGAKTDGFGVTVRMPPKEEKVCSHATG